MATSSSAKTANGATRAGSKAHAPTTEARPATHTRRARGPRSLTEPLRQFIVDLCSLRVLKRFLGRRKLPSTGDSTAEAEAKALVLVGYAATMQAVQRLELALKHFAVTKADLPDAIGFDEAWGRTVRILRTPWGPLEKQLPSDLEVQIGELRQIRNDLAHEVLLRWQIDTAIGLATDQQVADWFVEIEGRFSEMHALVSLLAEDRMKAQGIDPADIDFTPGELRRMITGEPDDAES